MKLRDLAKLAREIGYVDLGAGPGPLNIKTRQLIRGMITIFSRPTCGGDWRNPGRLGTDEPRAICPGCADCLRWGNE